MPTFTTDDGLELAYHEWGTEFRGVGPPVVLQHGFIAGTRWNWVEPGIVAALSGSGRHVVALDARGHGESDGPHEPSFYGEDRMAADLSQLYDVLDVATVHQVGYSMGAIISLIVASRDRRVGRLVVGGVGAGVVELGGMDTRAMPDDLLTDALLADDTTSIAHPGARAFRDFADAIGADRAALAAQAQSVHRAGVDLASIVAPTLVVAGEDDDLAARPHVLVEEIAGASLLTVPGDHMRALRTPELATGLMDFLTD